MVTYSDVTKRHIIYFTALLEVIVFAEFPTFLAVLLLVDLGIVNRHMRAPWTLAVFVSLLGPVAASLCVNLSHHTWWYAHGMPLLGVPVWLSPLHGLFAHWVLDSYWLVTLKEARKATLP